MGILEVGLMQVEYITDWTANPVRLIGRLFKLVIACYHYAIPVFVSELIGGELANIAKQNLRFQMRQELCRVW